MNKLSLPFWQGKRVLVTGHTGFKGCWLTLWLQRLGAEVTGVALASNTHPNLFTLANVSNNLKSYECDIRDAYKVSRAIQKSKPEIVFHLAAQSLVRASYRDPLATYATNIQGTANVLDSLRGLEQARVVVAITTDKVYRNLEQPYPYRETDHLGGHDPYSASKAAAELVVASYRDAFLEEQGVAVATARAGNVIGGGDWAEDRLLPDAARAWSAGQPLYIRRPESVRPWQHVLEPLSAYMRLAEQLYVEPQKAGAYNFGPLPHDAATVEDVITQACKSFGSGEIEWGDGRAGPHEANWLALETAKARTILGIEPNWELVQAVDYTMNWYRRQLAGESAQALCLENITAYESQ
ncbi:CDP-glucose 4,6-dehydratase [Halomonas sp. FeN2]|uniref:CDP-glucose 4,6-dehydratase n=1 Tax=Halomonas sp. FeN2 TaxID=2832500 RepID=UPI000C3B1A70|nr:MULTISPECIES: CDP-glucose 4,6-dehydratase [unclassified Halomonas]MBF58486.1 CDP-glucose 4,6-dehydratase [Halomonas sp.]UBR51271.1 CDP-glucose 4,6-dehydratase [Halomonas sp. FeN2]|tara:strand:- start:5581 stop:6639 length:1059 start_codon:yes stop_codon:yes gene_type:complete